MLNSLKSFFNQVSVAGYVRAKLFLLHRQTMLLFFFGSVLLIGGLQGMSIAQEGLDEDIPGNDNPQQEEIRNCNEEPQEGDGAEVSVNFDCREITRAQCDLLRLIHGSFGALLMTVAGIGAVISSAIGMYRAGYTMAVVGVGSFILPSLVTLWFGEPDCASVGSWIDPRYPSGLGSVQEDLESLGGAGG